MHPLRGRFQAASGSKVGLAHFRVSGLKGRGGSGEEGPGSGHSGEPIEGRRKVQDWLGGRDEWEVPQDTAANVCCFVFDTELHVAQIILELVI